MVTRSGASTGTFVPSGADSSLGVFDVNTWDSYEFRCYRSTPGGPSDREQASVTFRWTEVDPRTSSSEVPSADVSWRWMTDHQLSVKGPHLGPWLEVLVTPHADNNALVYSLTSSSQDVPDHEAMQETGQLLDVSWVNVAAGGNGTEEYALPASGPATLVLGATGSKMRFRVNLGGAAWADYTVDPAIDGTKQVEIELPRAAASVRPTNIGAVPGNGSARLVSAQA